MLKKIKKFLNRSLNTNEINYEDLNKIMSQNNGVLIDVRSKQEYKEEHFPNAINISVYDLESKIKKQVPNKNTLIIVYCSSGVRSKQAQKILEKMGYEQVYNLKNGLQNIIF